MRLSAALLFAILAGLVLLSSGHVRADEDAPAAEDNGGGEEAEEVSPHKEKLASAKNKETHSFGADVDKLMGLIIHSIYSSRDIFLRELLSNASDALDKIRFASLTDAKALETSKDPELSVRIKADKETNTLTIIDNGIGMSKAELIKNLGTIAHSGTKRFLETIGDKGEDGVDNNLIGQFGVGFYSSWLVSDTVEVTSKGNGDDTQWVWMSESQGKYDVYEDPEGNTLGRGTRISLHLKEDAREFLEVGRLRSLIERYSQFINFPIYLWTSSEVEEEVPVEEEAEDDSEKKDEDKDEDKVEEVDAESEDGEKKPKTKKVKKTVWDWERVNESRPVWTRSPEDVTDEDYEAFYKSISKDYQGPMARTHFVAEGELEFRSILFVPKDPPRDMFEAEGAKNNMKLYVRRVFIKDEDLDLLPRYLNFLRGVVDSNDLPLNVSREMLQQSKTLRVIRKKLVRKALEMFKNLADADAKAEEEGDDAEAKDGDDDDKKDGDKKEKKYDAFWKAYGKALKLGIVEDAGNKSKISKLLRFVSSKSDGGLVSLTQYVENMKEGQDQIYYLAGDSVEAIEASPFLERLRSRDIEVLYFTDAIDEYTAQTLTEFDGKKLINISKEGSLKLGGDDEELEKKRAKAYEKQLKPLGDFIKELVGSSKISKVVVSDRIAESPAVIVASKYGQSAQMAKIQQAQALSAGGSVYQSPKIMEINPRHPIVRRLAELVESDKDAEKTKEAAHLLYDSALITSGYNVEDLAAFAKRMQKALRAEIDVEAEAALGDDTDIDAVIAKEEEEEAAKKAEEEAKGGDDEEEEEEEGDEDGDGESSGDDDEDDKDEL